MGVDGFPRRAGATGPTGPTGVSGVVGATGATGVPALTPTAKTGTYTAVSGDLVQTTNSFTITLPTPSPGRLVGVFVTDARTGAAPVTITTPSGLIIGPGIGVASVGAASMVLGIQSAFVTLLADGTNWFVIAGEQDTGHIVIPFTAGEQTLTGHVSSYRKKGEWVSLRGFTMYVSGSAPWPICTLPTGFRPLNSCYFATQGTSGASASGATFVLSLEATGILSAQQNAENWTGGYMSLAPVMFVAVG